MLKSFFWTPAEFLYAWENNLSIDIDGIILRTNKNKPRTTVPKIPLNNLHSPYIHCQKEIEKTCKDIKSKAKSFRKLKKGAKLKNYDWVIWISGADLNSIRSSNENELAKQTDKILSDDLMKGYLIKTFNFEQNKNINFIIGLTSDLSKNLKEKKYTQLLESGQLLIERYKKLDQKYDNVYFLPFQSFINKDDRSNYTDKFDGVHYSDKSMNTLSNEIVKIINSKK